MTRPHGIISVAPGERMRVIGGGPVAAVGDKRPGARRALFFGSRHRIFPSGRHGNTCAHFPDAPMLHRFLPSHDSIKSHRLLRWLGPRLHDPSLWRINRHAVAKAVAIGAFFGLMIPVAQIPAAVIVSLSLRANLWIASVSTLISNPFTYAPLYYFAYHLGAGVLGIPPRPDDATPPVYESFGAWLAHAWEWLSGIGQPLLLGMLLMAVVGSIAGYFLTQALWRWRVLSKRRRSLRARISI